MKKITAHNIYTLAVFTTGVALVGVISILIVRAAPSVVSVQGTGNSVVVKDSADAYSGNYIEFSRAPSLPGSSTNWQKFSQMNIGALTNSNVNVGSGQDGSMRVVCKTSHFNYDDPIVAPNQRGAAHLHMFFGNTLANYQSSNKSLQETGGGTCSGNELNRTAYWMPALIDKQNRARPAQYIEVYYKSGPLHGRNIQPIPQGLVMIAGNAGANAVSENTDNYQWHCKFPPNYPGYYGFGKTIPNCKQGDALRLVLVYPNCWDGKNLDSGDHRSHMAYSNGFQPNGSCPSSHPVPIPQITYNVHWNNSDQTTDGWYLSSDRADGKNLPGGTTTHGDWFGAWHPTIMNTFVSQCNNQNHDCKGATISRTQRLIPTTTPSLSEGNIYSPSRAPDTPIPVSSIRR